MKKTHKLDYDVKNSLLVLRNRSQKENKNEMEDSGKHNIMKTNLPVSLRRKVNIRCIPPALGYTLEPCCTVKDLERKLRSA